MTIEPIGKASVVLYLTPADLSHRGLSPGTLTPDQALSLAKEAFHQTGMTLDGTVEIEAYPECCGVLVFAHVRPTGPVWFSFDSLEALMEAALELHSTSVDATLWWREGRYWLALPPEAEGAVEVCRDYAQLRQLGPEEGGQLLFPHHALWHLCRHFLRLHL